VESELTGTSAAMCRLRRAVPNAATDASPIVIVGEAGTGKTHLARIIHAKSPLRDRPPFCVDLRLCAGRDRRTALFGGEPPDLTTTRRGAFERPTTVILKACERAEPYLQERIAGTLRTGETVRFGAAGRRRAAARPLFLFHEPPRLLAARGALCRELFDALAHYRTLTIPPLRRRRGDIPLLAEKFLGRMPAAPLLRRLMEREWEENVRGLEAYLAARRPGRRDDGAVEEEIMMLRHLLAKGGRLPLAPLIGRLKMQIARAVAHECGGNRAEAAARLGMSERTLGRLVARAASSTKA